MERVSQCLKSVYGTSEPAGERIWKTVHKIVPYFPPDLSVHRTRLMKESHDRLLHLCSSVDRGFLDIQVPPTKMAKRKKGTSPPPLNHRLLTSTIRHQGKV